jgi:UDP-N-acetylglucosamine transferase subunit ALG13
VNLYVQWPHLATRRWAYRGSVLDGFEPAAQGQHVVKHLVVSLGTSSRYSFRRLVERLVEIVPSDVEVLWQTGSTDVTGLGIRAQPALSSADLTAAITKSDAVVAHAGAGIALTILASGKVPVLVPRLASHGEHVDDHQEQIAEQLSARGLAVVTTVDNLDWEVVCATARRGVTSAANLPAFVLSNQR